MWRSGGNIFGGNQLHFQIQPDENSGVVENTNYDGDTNICNGNSENFKSSVVVVVITSSAIAVISSSRETHSTAYTVVVVVA